MQAHERGGKRRLTAAVALHARSKVQRLPHRQLAIVRVQLRRMKGGRTSVLSRLVALAAGQLQAPASLRTDQDPFTADLILILARSHTICHAAPRNPARTSTQAPHT